MSLATEAGVLTRPASPPDVAAPPEFAFTGQDFDWLRRRMNAYSGIELPETKRQMVYSRLAKRLRLLGLRTFAEYRQRLEAGDPAEFREFVNSLTTNVTAFFREPHHFEHLAQMLEERYRRPAGPGGDSLRIWSAASSTGEEPYSIATTVLDWMESTHRSLDFHLLATDLDTNVLAHAARGIYREESVQALSPGWKRRWLLRGQDENAGLVRMRPEAQAVVEFRPWNLVSNWTSPGPVDVIFCRNVVIYFSKETQRQLFERFAHTLAPGGYLYIGHSESLLGISNRFDAVGRTIYRLRE